MPVACVQRKAVPTNVGPETCEDVPTTISPALSTALALAKVSRPGNRPILTMPLVPVQRNAWVVAPETSLSEPTTTDPSALTAVAFELRPAFPMSDITPASVPGVSTQRNACV